MQHSACAALCRGWIVHPDIEPSHGEVFFEERSDLVPVPSSEPAADARHMDDRSPVDPARQFGQASSERVIADRHGIGLVYITVLRHHIGNTEVIFHLDQLNHPQAKLLATSRPAPVRRFGLWPAAADCQDESLPPAARVVANVGDDTMTPDGRGRGIPDEVGDRHHTRLRAVTDISGRPVRRVATTTNSRYPGLGHRR